MDGGLISKNKREEIVNLLAHVHLDNEYLLERVCELYRKIYGGRSQRRGFRKSERKERVATAFAICNTLRREKMPRPVEHVTSLCGLTKWQPLLNIPHHLSLSEDELRGLSRDDYELRYSSPEEYVEVICAVMEIPFKTRQDAKRLAREVEWALYGRQPTVITAAVIQSVMARKGASSDALRKTLCDNLDCTQKAVDAALAKMSKVV